MKSKYCFIILLLSISILHNNCKKEKIHPIEPLGPLVLTPYHISAMVDGNLVDAAYSYQDPDTLLSGYRISTKYLNIRRYVSGDNNLPLNEGWCINSSGINLDQITYPITFWPSRTTTYGVKVSYQLDVGGGLWANAYDTTLFSITLDRFDHDTLSGTFQGKLFHSPDYTESDSMATITSGTFKVLLVRIQ